MKAVKLFTALLLAMVCISLSSCSKDDEGNGDSDSDFNLVGTWTDSNKGIWFQFNAGGTGKIWEQEDGDIAGEESFAYVYDQELGKLTLKNPDDGEEIESIKIKQLTNDKITAEWDDYDEQGGISVTLYRQ